MFRYWAAGAMFLFTRERMVGGFWSVAPVPPFPILLTSDTKMREFQFKLLNKYLATNAFLYKIGVVSSPVCSFCEKKNESLKHIFIHCNYTAEFWAEVIKWLRSVNVNINILNNK